MRSRAPDHRRGGDPLPPPCHQVGGGRRGGTSSWVHSQTGRSPRSAAGSASGTSHTVVVAADASDAAISDTWSAGEGEGGGGGRRSKGSNLDPQRGNRWRVFEVGSAVTCVCSFVPRHRGGRSTGKDRPRKRNMTAKTQSLLEKILPTKLLCACHRSRRWVASFIIPDAAPR